MTATIFHLPQANRAMGEPTDTCSPSYRRARLIRARCQGRRIESPLELSRLAVATREVVEEAMRTHGLPKHRIYEVAGLAHGGQRSSKAAHHYEMRAEILDGLREDRAALSRESSRLTKTPSKYIALLDAVASLTGGDASALVVRVFGGTPLEPDGAPDDWDEPDQDIARRDLAHMLSAGRDWVLREVPDLDAAMRRVHDRYLRYDDGAGAWVPRDGLPAHPESWRPGPALYLGRVTLSGKAVHAELLGRDGTRAEAVGRFCVDAEVWLALSRPTRRSQAPELAIALAETSYLYLPDGVLANGMRGVRAETLSPHFSFEFGDGEEVETDRGTLLIHPPEDEEDAEVVDSRARCYGPYYVAADAAGLMDLDARVKAVHGSTPLGMERISETKAQGPFSRRLEKLIRHGFPVPPDDAGEAIREERPHDGVYGPFEYLRDRGAAMTRAMARLREAEAEVLDTEWQAVLQAYRPA